MLNRLSGTARRSSPAGRSTSFTSSIQASEHVGDMLDDVRCRNIVDLAARADRLLRGLRAPDGIHLDDARDINVRMLA